MKRIISILIAAMLLLLSGCGSSNTPADTGGNQSQGSESIGSMPPESSDSDFDMDVYHQLVDSFQTATLLAGQTIADIGQHEVSYLLSGKPAAKMVDEAFEWSESEKNVSLADVEKLDGELLDTFINISSVEGGGAEVDAIFSKVNDLFTAYTALYSQVTTPPIDTDAFVDELVEYMNAVVDASDALDAAQGQ